MLNKIRIVRRGNARAEVYLNDVHLPKVRSFRIESAVGEADRIHLELFVDRVIVDDLVDVTTMSSDVSEALVATGVDVVGNIGAEAARQISESISAQMAREHSRRN